LFVGEATNVLVEDSESVCSVFSWFWFELRMVLISVTSCCSTYIGNSVVIYHKKSSDLVIGNLLFRLGTLLVNFSTVAEPFSLLGFMGHVMVCSSKGFAEFCLLMGSISHFRGIIGVFLLLLSTSL
jgi:hypothetical protein